MEIKTENNVRLGDIELEDGYVYLTPRETRYTTYMLEQALKIMRKIGK